MDAGRGAARPDRRPACRTPRSRWPTPALWLRPDVYATHGHYLDLHLTVPRLESIVASAMARVSGRARRLRLGGRLRGGAGAACTRFFAGLAQGAAPRPLSSAAARSRGRLAAARTARPPRRCCWGGWPSPAPWRRSTASARPVRGGDHAARSCAARASPRCGAWQRRSAPGADHVLFGHTHRPGPLPGDDRPSGRPPAARGSGTAAAGATSARSSGAAGEPQPLLAGHGDWLDDDGPAADRERAARRGAGADGVDASAADGTELAGVGVQGGGTGAAARTSSRRLRPPAAAGCRSRRPRSLPRLGPPSGLGGLRRRRQLGRRSSSASLLRRLLGPLLVELHAPLALLDLLQLSLARNVRPERPRKPVTPSRSGPRPGPRRARATPQRGRSAPWPPTPAGSCPPSSSRSRSRSPGPRATSTSSPCGSR